MRIALLFVAVLAASACKKSPPVEDPGDLGLGGGSGSGTSSGAGDGTGTGEGTGEGTGSETAIPADLERVVDDYLSAFEAVAAAAEGANDCPGMAQAIQDASAAGLDAMKAFEAYPPEQVEANNQAINDKFGPRIDEAASRLGEAAERCEDDPDVQAELDAMGF